MSRPLRFYRVTLAWGFEDYQRYIVDVHAVSPKHAGEAARQMQHRSGDWPVEAMSLDGSGRTWRKGPAWGDSWYEVTE